MEKNASLIKKAINTIKSKGDVAIIPYICCWDPDLETTEAILWELAEVEPACIELGFPFSDPVADGPTIQKAIVRALEHQPTFEAYFEFILRLNQKGFPYPIVCMTYYNIIYRFGLEKTVEHALQSGLAGFIIPDLPIEEAQPWIKANQNSGLATIFLATPTSSEDRIQKIVKHTKGFLYYVSITGITGARDSLPEDLADRLKITKNLCGNNLPLAVGFGISKKEQIKLLYPYADAFIIGSAIVKIIEEKGKNSPKEIKTFLKNLKNL
ncbi:MAG: Tryptophan synthase alpha chain [Thermodesulfobacterium commune]|uniref:tryptophan synthase subunit alpha n=1 Tax=Thermodesulfobacterium commune TaxID=1741 RepID=UPI000748D564|nr:MAG: Tryptophan synthase alpha chain [Thermodesulfobacterium commune]MDK2861333.1 tryptophan synthase alpha chain [Thermodesulfobacterium sp.]